MKVAILIDSLIRGGAERQALNAILHLPRLGCEVELIYYHQVTDPYDPPAGSPAKITYLPKGSSRGRFLWRLAEHFKQGGFDVVHAFKGTENLYGSLAGRLAGTPVVLGGFRVEYKLGGVIRWGHRAMRRLVDGWVVNARAIADSMVTAIGARPEDFFILYNGIEPEAFVSRLTPAEAKRRLGLDPGCPVVAKMARLHPQKNHPMFLRMAAAVLQRRPDARFLIVGDGSLRAALEEQARSMGLGGAVLFLGLRGDVPDLLAATDVSVLTSDFEGLANALLEAMSVGLPVVTTGYPGVEEIITDRQQGFVVPCGDAQTMAEVICRLLDNDDLRREMGQCGVRTVKTRFSMEAMASNLFSIYQTCLERKGRSAP